MTDQTVASFIAECFWPDVREELVTEVASRVRASAAGVARSGNQVCLTGSILVPDDEVVFFLFDADSADAVRRVCNDACVPFDRIVESVGLGPAPPMSRYEP